MSEIRESVARAICKSRTCEGFSCCEWPANAGRRHDCSVSKGKYDDAANAATVEVLKQCAKAVSTIRLNQHDLSESEVAMFEKGIAYAASFIRALGNL